MAPNSSQGLDPSDAAVAVAVAAGVEHDQDDEPLNGSWVAEYEDAKLALTKALRKAEEAEEEGRGDGGAASDNVNNSEGAEAAVLQAYLRLCRAYSKLRRWERLLVVSQRGLTYARGLSSTGPRAAESSFREYRKLARTELAVETDLDKTSGVPAPFKDGRDYIRHLLLVVGQDPDTIRDRGHANANLLQEAVLKGDVRLMEELVAMGARIDLPFPESFNDHETNGREGLQHLPPGASALLMACAKLATQESNDPYWVFSRVSGFGFTKLDQIAECAMQLVNLGADPSQKMPNGLGAAFPMWQAFEGKSALQMAAMSKRRPLAELILKHVQLRPKGRAEVVHCRCGSRLPWKQCHATGVGQPSHYKIQEETGELCFRLSPLARCPCENTKKEYYKCCWGDTRTPSYMLDKSECYLIEHFDKRFRMPSFGRRLNQLATHAPVVASALRMCEEKDDWILPCARLFPAFPTLFTSLCQDVGPKSRMAGWDRHVYAGCVERLEVPFLWRDIHWDLDKAVLLRRSDDWNKALHKYCDDVGLQGEERARVVSTHTARPCGPCGYIGCEAFEGKVREFERCSRCQTVAYCRRKCQKKDWAEHQKVCQASSVTVSESTTGEVRGLGYRAIG